MAKGDFYNGFSRGGFFKTLVVVIIMLRGIY